MAGLQRSAVSFRRQGSSGQVWENNLISEMLNNSPQNDGESSAAAAAAGEVKPGRILPPIKTTDRSRSNRGGGRGFRSKETAPLPAEPPSPRVSACGLCSAFGKSGGKKQRATAAGKRRSR